MIVNPDIVYHLKELEIALNQSSASYAMPEFFSTDQAILDIGCGIGQTFVASVNQHGKLLVGLDINLIPINYGYQQYDFIRYVNGSAEHLPFQQEIFDHVVSRVRTYP